VAALLLAVNLAYLRLDRFQHLIEIRKHAERVLVDISQAEKRIPRGFLDTKDYKLIAAWAGKDIGNDTNNHQGLMDRIYKNAWDRRFSSVMVCVGFILVTAGAAHATGQIGWAASLFSGSKILWTFWPLVLLTGTSVVLVLIGDRYVSSAIDDINEAADNFQGYLIAVPGRATIED